MRINPIYLLALGVAASCLSAFVHLDTVDSDERRSVQTQVELAANLLTQRLRLAVLENNAAAAQSLLELTLPLCPVESAVVVGLDGEPLATWNREPVLATNSDSAGPVQTSTSHHNYPILTGRRPIGVLLIEPRQEGSPDFVISGLAMQSILPLLVSLLGYALLRAAAQARSPSAFERGDDERERAKLERELANSQVELEKASRAKSMFLANMSHEIRTPLNGVLGMADLLLHTRLDDQQTKFATTVRNSAESLLNIVNDLLDFSRI